MLYNKFQVIFLSEMMSLPPDSTNRHIAEIIIENIMSFETISIVDLAKMCNVGTGSISRFCTEIGLHGFSELKQIIQEEQARRKQTENQIYFSQQDSTNAISQAISQAIQSLDANKIHKLIKDIDTFQNIYALGLLKAFNAANNLQADLYLLNKTIHTDAHFHNQLNFLVQSQPTDLFIIFSYTGNYFNYERFAKYSTQLKRPKIWMISGQKCNFPDYVDEVIYFDSKLDYQSHPYQLEAIASYICSQYEQYIKQ